MDKITFEMLHTPCDAPIEYERRNRQIEHEKAMKKLEEYFKKLREIKEQKLIASD